MMSVDYQETPFAEVVRNLRERLSINILVYWPSLREAGIRVDDPVTLVLNNVSAEKVIDPL